MPTPEAELRPLLALRGLAGVGDAAQAALFARFGGPAAAWSAWPRGWSGVVAGSVTAADRATAWASAERAAEALARLGAFAVDLTRPEYPASLRHLHDPPAACFLLGRVDLLDAPMVAVVGSRACTPHGLEAARWLAAQLARAGLVVASGLARGIDGAAHEAALAVGGPTVAVLGSGLDVAYPPENRALQETIGRQGLLVSEFLPGEAPRPHHFPRRNRLIAALARGVLVVEAGANSGALGTADHALDLGRPVMAVPGPITSPSHEGSNRLLRDGAPIVLDVDDVLRALLDHGWDGRGMETAAPGRAAETPDPARAISGAAGRRGPPEGEPAGLAPRERGLWRALDREPRHVDDLCARSGLPTPEALAALSNLEFRGLARQVSGMRFVRG